MISLVLATVGRVTETQRFIDSLLEQTVNDYELIIIDQNIDERLQPLCAAALARGVPLRRLRLQPANLSAARNLGIREAQGRFVAFPDDDCWYEPQAVEMALAALGGPTPADGAVGRWVEQSETDARSTVAGKLSAEEWRRFRGGDASSITLFFSTALLRELGGFDENFGVGRYYGCGEETDLLMRALAGGAHIVRDPSIRVHHHHSTAREVLSGPAMRRARSRGRGIGGLYAKHRLTLFVILRGLLSGWLKPILRLEGIGPMAIGSSEALGRLEGWLRWRWKEAPVKPRTARA